MSVISTQPLAGGGDAGARGSCAAWSGRRQCAQRQDPQDGANHHRRPADLGQRDLNGSFELQLVKKRQVRLAGMEEKIPALYAGGMTTRDIEAALVDLYGAETSRALMAQVPGPRLGDQLLQNLLWQIYGRRGHRRLPLTWA